MSKFEIIDITKDYRGPAYERFKDACNPMVSITSKVDITRLVKLRKKHKLNTMLLYCVQNAAQNTKSCHYDFYQEDKVAFYDKVCTNWVTPGKDKRLCFISVPYAEKFEDYEKNYNEYYRICYEECRHNNIDDEALVSTSVVNGLDIQSCACGYTADFLRPFLVWGKYNKEHFRYYINISFRFHHAFFEGKDIELFFNNLKTEIANFNKK